MSTGLSGEQLDALRAGIYEEWGAATEEIQCRFEAWKSALAEHNYGHHTEREAFKRYLEIEGVPKGFSRALFLLDSARRAAAQSKVGSKR